MLRYARKYSLSPRGFHRANSPLISLLVALALLGVVAVVSWSKRLTIPVRPLPPTDAELAAPVPARVLKVIDGDTFDARVELKPGFRITTRVRVRGIDAPELHAAACERERIGAEVAQRALRSILTEGGVTIRDLGEDRYGRLLGTVATRATPNVGDALIAKGLVRRYDGGRRAGWC